MSKRQRIGLSCLIGILGVSLSGLIAPPANAHGDHHGCAQSVDARYTTVRYTTDDFHAEVKYSGEQLCEGVSKTVSFNSYQTEGPSWETSGNQLLVDHQQFTIDKYHTTGALVVKQPSCNYQTDLYWGSTRYDGTDGALPHYPNTATPYNLIAARNGGTDCSTPSKDKVYGNVTFTEGSVDCVNNQVIYAQPTYMVTGSEHVVYDVARGEHTANFGDTVIVNATGVDDSSKYELSGSNRWSHTFGNKPNAPEGCEVPPTTDACPSLAGDQPQGFQCEPKTQKQARHVEKGPNCKSGTSITKEQERTRTQRFVNDQWKWGKWSKWKTVSSTAVTLPSDVCQAKVRAQCVTTHWGEGFAVFINKGSDTSKRFRLVRSGKDRVVTVGAHKNRRINLTGLRVGSIIKVKGDGKVLARAKVKGGCGHTPPPDTGARQAAG